MQKVLLVDDVRLFLELEKTILNRRNLQVFTATSGQEAIEIHRREKVDLILCDLYMPGMNGDETCRLIRSEDAIKSVAIIMVTTSASEDDIDRCMKAGANDYIAKPINPTELLKKIGTYIDVAMRSSTRIFVRLRVEGTAESRAELFIGTTVNLSATGFLIETPHPFNIGETASFSLTIPNSPAPLHVVGEVVRKAGGTQPKLNYYGIRLTEVTETDRNAVEEYVKAHPEAVV